MSTSQDETDIRVLSESVHQGVTTRMPPERATLCLLRAGGSWRIVHERTCVPFYMDGSLRPAFDLNP
jgi:ketosteroid isomerase-like protein